MYWLAFFMCLLMVYGLSSWLPKLMTQAGYGFSSSLNFLLALNLGAMLGAILGGYLGDKFNLHNTIIVFFLIAAISISQLGFKNSTFILYLFSAIAGATTNGTSILMYSLVAQSYSSDLRTKGIGWASGIGRLGAIIGPQIGGILLSKSLPFQQNFYAFAFAGVIAALSIIIVKIKSSL
jgi:AAHS family benzoate transporter-like MFS transporter